MTTYDRDALIRMAIVPADTVHAPAELGDDIFRTILETPQRRKGLQLGRPRWLPSPMPSMILLALLGLLLAGVVIVALSRTPSIPPILAMYHGGPDRTGQMPGPGPAGDPVRAWQANLNGAVPFTIMPLVSQGQVVVADDGGSVSALDESSGAKLWSTDIGSPIRASPVLVGDLVITGSDAGDIVALAAVDGAERWRFRASGPVSASIAVTGTEVYVASEAGTLHVLDANSGREQWFIEIGGSLTRGPAIADGVVYIGTAEGRFLAIDAATHRPIWERRLGPNGIGTPAVAGGLVYFGHGLESGPAIAALVALDAETGRDVWTFPVAAGFQIHAGAIGEAVIYGTSTDQNVYALDRTTGARLWTYATGSSNGALAGLVGGVLYVSSSDGTIHAVDAASGNELWRFRVEGDPTTPVVIDGRVIVGTTFGRVVAIEGSQAP